MPKKRIGSIPISGTILRFPLFLPAYEEVLHYYINKEWRATKRAMVAERKVRELQDQLRKALDNGIDADV